MKTTIQVLTGFALLLGTFLQPSTAFAGDTLLFRGKGADAYFLRTEGCLITEVFVFVSEIVSRPPKDADPIFEANVVITQYDFCEEEFLLSAEGSTPLSDADFQDAATLRSATLNTTVSVFDNISHASFDVFVDLTWIGIGPLRREIDNFHFKAPGCHHQLP